MDGENSTAQAILSWSQGCFMQKRSCFVDDAKTGVGPFEK